MLSKMQAVLSQFMAGSANGKKKWMGFTRVIMASGTMIIGIVLT